MSLEVHVTKLSASTCTDHKGAVDAELTVHYPGNGSILPGLRASAGELAAGELSDQVRADIDALVPFLGGTLTGLEVTLVPDHRGELTAWGSGLDHWCNDAALRAIRSYGESFDEDGDQRDERDLQDALIAAVQEAA